jgi:LysR family cys regulon transcriptional activator
VAYDPARDPGLVAINAAHLFPSCTTWIGFRRDRFLRNYMYSFLQRMAPGFDREHIDRVIASTGDVDHLNSSALVNVG